MALAGACELAASASTEASTGPAQGVHARPSDAQVLRRVVQNLIDNAPAYAGSAEVALRGDGGQVRIEVMDRGPGIPPEQLETVLKPFQRLESSRGRASGGTGLGLAIAQQLAQALGGELVLENRKGGGLCASLQLGVTAPASQ